MPRWSDDPAHLLGMIVNYLRLDDRNHAPDRQFAAADAEAEAMIRTLVDRLSRQRRARRQVVSFGLRRARQLVGLREMPKNLLVLALAGVRSQLALVGEALAGAGRIATAEDVFFLDFGRRRMRRSSAAATFLGSCCPTELNPRRSAWPRTDRMEP
jgi:rifampicin phosphotransferase